MAVVPSFFEVIFLFLFSGASTDLVSFLEPELALECLGEETTEASLKQLLAGKTGSGAGSYNEAEATRAIENLASSSDAIREKARGDLAAMGAGLRPRLEKVVASDPRRADEARKVLEKLGAAAKAAANRTEVAQLLALRLAGDRKLTDLAPAVEKLRDHPSPFISRAAEEVRALLKGEKPPALPARPWLDSLAPAEALSAETRFLMETRLDALESPKPLRIDEVMKGFVAQFAGLGGAPGEEQMEQMMRQATQAMVDAAVKYGNARLDKVTLANVGGVGPRGGGLGIVFTGDYQKAVLEEALAETPGISVAQEIEGIRIFSAGGDDLRVACLDEHNILLLPEDASVGFPLTEYIQTFRAGKKPLREVARWNKFLDTLGEGSAARGLALTDETLMGEIYREMEREVPPDTFAAVKGMTEIEADIRQTSPEKTTYRAEAAFKEAGQAKALADFVGNAIQMGIQEVEREMERAPPPIVPMMEKVRDMMKGIHVVAEGKKGILRGDVDIQTLLQGFLTPLQMRNSRATELAPARAVAPAAGR